MFTTTRPRTASTVVVLVSAALAVLYLVAVGTSTGQFIDHELMQIMSMGFGNEVPVEGVLGRYQLPLLAAGGLVVGAVVAGRRSVGLAVSAAAILGTTVVGAYVLKAVLDRPAFGIGPLLNSFPSNTVAVVAALSLILVGASAPPYRGLALLVVTSIGCIVSVLVVAQQWHRPADVLGAWLLATGSAAAVRVARAAWAWTSDVEGGLAGGQTAPHRG